MVARIPDAACGAREAGAQGVEASALLPRARGTEPGHGAPYDPGRRDGEEGRFVSVELIAQALDLPFEHRPEGRLVIALNAGEEDEGGHAVKCIRISDLAAKGGRERTRPP